jgi:acetyl-CoA synthetase
MKLGRKWPNRYNLSSLKILGSVGEPINPKAWQWFFEVIGKKSLPIIDTWWQTETGGFMISPRAVTPTNKLKPGSAFKNLPGISAKVLGKDGCEAKPGQKGYLVITKPWPGMTTTIYKDQKKYKETYWSKFKDAYFTGDYAVKDNQGYFFILGRADEVIIVAGHNISTIEVENAAMSLPFVNEVAAIGVKDEIKGQQITVFATTNSSKIANAEKKIMEKIRTVIGPIATPSKVILVDKLPKTRSGKILRRMLGKLSENQAVGDTSTLENEDAVASIKKHIKK